MVIRNDMYMSCYDEKILLYDEDKSCLAFPKYDDGGSLTGKVRFNKLN